MTTIEKLKIMLEAPASTSIVAYRTFLKDMLEESEKYRWHDLRKDPEDLPDDLHKVLIHIKGYEDYMGVDMAMHHKFTGIWSTIFASYKDGDVIAWREIEPFEER